MYPPLSPLKGLSLNCLVIFRVNWLAFEDIQYTPSGNAMDIPFFQYTYIHSYTCTFSSLTILYRDTECKSGIRSVKEG